MKTYTLTLLSIGASLGVIASAQDAGKPPKPPKKHHLTFEQADVDLNGGLDVFEFATTQGAGTPLVEIRRRFLPIDISGAFEEVIDPVTGATIPGDAIPDGLVSLDELKAYRALEDKPKSDLSRFDLADFDGDGVLSPVELGYLVSPKVAAAKTLRKFSRLDDDDDGSITPAEFKKTKTEEI